MMVIVASFFLLATSVVPVRADGGPIITDQDVWEELEEGQQVAVVALEADGAVRTDLFISLIDHTGVSHEINFFFPLGWDASGLSVSEDHSSNFEAALTDQLDDRLRRDALERGDLVSDLYWSSLPGSYLINGGWTWMALVVFALVGCSGAPDPVEVLYTENAQVAVYDMDEDTDLAALIAISGLDPAVQDTLRALEGQQVAVVSIRTQALLEGDGGGYVHSQWGLHLQWTSRAVEREDGGWEHRYPLGTGGAWARPIPLTRVYVIAPDGVDFWVDYPVYGSDYTGYDSGLLFASDEPKIYRHLDQAGYAVNELVTAQGEHVWRGVYTQANPTEDLRIVHDAQASRLTRDEISGSRLRQFIRRWVWLYSIVLALGLWLICWRYVMPAYLGRTYRWSGLLLWRDAIVWALVHPVINILILAALFITGFVVSRLMGIMPGGIGDVFIILINLAVGTLGALLAFASLVGLFTVGLFAWWHKDRSRASRGYVKVVVLSNVSYVVLEVIGVVLLFRLAG
jgi:hypothetical protein